MNALSARCPCGGKPRSNVGLCARCYNRAWYAKNGAERREKAAAYYQRNKERIRKYKAEWRAKERAERGRAPYQHRDVYKQEVVAVSVKGWGCRV